MFRLHHDRTGGGWPGGILLIVLLLALAGCTQSAPDGNTETRTISATVQASSTAAPPAPPPTDLPGSAIPSAAEAAPSPTARPTAEPTATRTAPASAMAPPATPSPTTTPLPPAPSPSAVPEATRVEPVRPALQPVAGGLDRPVFVTHAGDGSGRLFVVEKGGKIRVLEPGQQALRLFLDIRDRVGSQSSEQGLLGLAFPSDYGQTGDFFVNYTDLSGNTVVSRFRVTADPNIADPASEFRVLEIAQPAPNHNGGMLAFGPDGFLYVGTGDGGGSNDRFGNGQNPQSLLGKMLRLDVSGDPARPYTIPPDNPWINVGWNGQETLDEIWAVGLRNPWRYSFDRQSGDLWIADVGQNAYEEVNRVPAGAGGAPQGGLNFGWPMMEGIHCFPDGAACNREGLTLPIAEYRHGEDGCSITGGYVYRGADLLGLAGAYLYGDYCSGRIWALEKGTGGKWSSRLLLESGLAISSFGEDQAGELYVADLAGGAIYRLTAR